MTSTAIVVFCTAGHPSRRANVVRFRKRSAGHGADIDADGLHWNPEPVTSTSDGLTQEVDRVAGTGESVDGRQLIAEMFQDGDRVDRKVRIECALCGLKYQRLMQKLAPLLDQLAAADVVELELAHLVRLDEAVR